jgi:hypothetical protein
MPALTTKELRHRRLDDADKMLAIIGNQLLQNY